MVAGRGTRFHYGPVDDPAVGDPELDRFCNRTIPYDVVIVHTVPEYFPFWIDAERGRPIIGHTVWETTAIPAHWRSLLNAVDRLLVPCQWNKSVFDACGVTVPIDVIPHVLDEQATAGAPRAECEDGDGYVFYTIGVWSHRKALYRTVQAFCEAFTADDPVTLVVKTNPDDLTVTGLRRYLGRSVAQAVHGITRRYPRPPRIRLRVEDLSDEGIRRLHRRGDCYVSLCRGEGWGIGAFDAVAHGKPVVMTGFGGQLDFLDRDLAYLVGFDLVPVDNPQAPLSYSPDQRWAEPDVQDGARRLREVVADPGAASARGCALRDRLPARFGERAVIDRLTPVLAAATGSPSMPPALHATPARAATRET